MALNDFDSIALYYDKIARLIFGSSLENCQLAFIDSIPKGAKVLILGGGTGCILQELIVNIESVSVTYVEKSFKMIKIAKSQITEKELSQIKFINQPFETFNANEEYDVVIANFFLDVFSKGELADVISKIKKQLKETGSLLVSDFQIHASIISKMWQKPLLWIMHAFFKLTSRLASNKLQPIHEEILGQHFVLKQEKWFFGKIMFSRVYKT